MTYSNQPQHQKGIGVSTTVDIGALSVKDFIVGVVTQDAYKSSLDGIMGLGFMGGNSCTLAIQPE